MWQRRPLFWIVIGITLCLPLWHISIQLSQMSTDYQLYVNQRNVENDFETLIDLNDFKFLINQRPCAAAHQQSTKTNPLILFLIHTAPKHIRERQIIRETWGQSDGNSRLLFLVGMINETVQQQKLINENNIYMDLIQGNFIDAYRNMTYKHMMAFKWFIYYCQDVKFLIKTDDDILVNIPNLYKFIKDKLLPSSNNSMNYLINNVTSIYCLEYGDSLVKRTYRSKWRISPREYRGRKFPAYCSGPSIIYPADAVHTLYSAAQRMQYFWIDDVHITGIVRKYTNVTIIPLNDAILSKEQVIDIVNGKMNVNDISFLFSTHNLTEVELRNLWNVMRTYEELN